LNSKIITPAIQNYEAGGLIEKIDNYPIENDKDENKKLFDEVN
jgi:hypothetical protein